MTKYIIILLALLPQFLFAQSQTKIIDMHIHSYTDNDFAEREPPTDHYGTKGATNAEAHRLATFAAFKNFNIVKAVVSGNPESVKNWKATDSDQVVKKLTLFAMIVV